MQAASVGNLVWLERRTAGSSATCPLTTMKMAAINLNMLLSSLVAVEVHMADTHHGTRAEDASDDNAGPGANSPIDRWGETVHAHDPLADYFIPDDDFPL